MAEIHREEGEHLTWRYTPRLRDGRNQERKVIFGRFFAGGEARLVVPESPPEVKRFLDEVFHLVGVRARAHALR